MRVYELAWELRVQSSEVIAQLREQGEWVRSHLSGVAEPAADRLRTNPPAPSRADIDETTGIPRRLLEEWSSWSPVLSPPAVKRPPRPRPWRYDRRPPGPPPLTLRQPWDPDEDDYYDGRGIDLRGYGDQLTTRDIADIFEVTPATVRQWVRRGHLVPTGKHGTSNVFGKLQVVEQHDAIVERTRARGHRPGEEPWRWGPPQVSMIKLKYYDEIVSVTAAATHVGVSPATIQSWLHRGRLERWPTSTQRRTQLRLGDVIDVARGVNPRHRT